MSTIDPSVLALLYKAESDANAIVQSTPPNIEFGEVKYEDQLKIFKSVSFLKHKLPENLIGGIQTIVSQVILPNIDDEEIDHSIIFYRSRIAGIILNLTKALDAARSIGYFDPRAAEPRIDSSFYHEKLHIIEKELLDIKSSLKQISGDNDMNRPAGIALSIGIISVEIATIEKLANDGIALVRSSTPIAAGNLRRILTETNDKAKIIYEYIQEKPKFFGNKIVSAAKNLFRSSLEALQVGLETIKGALENTISVTADEKPPLAEAQREVASILRKNGIDAKDVDGIFRSGHTYSYITKIKNQNVLIIDDAISDKVHEYSIKKSTQSYLALHISENQAHLFNLIGTEHLSSICHTVLQKLRNGPHR